MHDRHSSRGLRRSFGFSIIALATLGCAPELAPSEERVSEAPAAVVSAPASTGHWTDAAPLDGPRERHRLTVLLDGRVMVSGDWWSTYDTTPSYDPATDTWNASASVGLGISAWNAVRLVDGRVLLPDWEDQLGQIYDPIADAWSEANLYVNKASTATLLADGTVLIVGGRFGFWFDDVSRHYDPVSDTEIHHATMPYPSAWHEAVRLEDGRVLIAGGWYCDCDASGEGPILTMPNAAIYDPAAKAWSLAEPMSLPRSGHRAALLAGGRVLVTGGAAGGGSATATSEVYDPETGTWSFVAPMSVPRQNHTMDVLPDGRVVVTGGSPGACTAEMYDPATNQWIALPPLSHPRSLHASALLPDGRLMVAGGNTTSVEIYTFGEVAIGDACSAGYECASGYCVGGTCASTP